MAPGGDGPPDVADNINDAAQLRLLVAKYCTYKLEPRHGPRHAHAPPAQKFGTVVAINAVARQNAQPQLGVLVLRHRPEPRRKPTTQPSRTYAPPPPL